MKFSRNSKTEWIVLKRGHQKRIVKNGFHWLGFVFGVFYLAYLGLWKQAFGLFLIVVAFVFGIGDPGVLGSLVVGCITGYYAPRWLLDKLFNEGWEFVGKAETKEEAEAMICDVQTA